MTMKTKKRSSGHNKYMITKYYFFPIKNNGIVIGKEMFSNFDVIAIIAPKQDHNAKCSLCLF